MRSERDVNFCKRGFGLQDMDTTVLFGRLECMPKSCVPCFFHPNIASMTSGYASHSLPHTEAAATLLADTGCSAVIEGANSPCTKAVSLTVVGVDSADGPQGRGALVLQDGVYRKKCTVATKGGGKTLDEWQT